MPPVVYLLCGLTGPGKTTCAKQLEAAGAVRLSVDEEVFARHGRYGVDYPASEYFALERPVVEELRRPRPWRRQRHAAHAVRPGGLHHPVRGAHRRRRGAG
jgi:hypothetical protein